MKIAVLGAGVSGLSIGRLLHDNGYDVTIFEKNSTVGGLARTKILDGYIYDLSGGHIFNSKHKEVMDFAFSLLPKENWGFRERNSKIYFNGKYVSYPFELSLCELDIDEATDCVYDFVMSKQGEEPTNFRDWLKWYFGDAIADYYMIPYNEKIWSYPLEDMETEWMQGKMPLPSKKEMIKSMLLKNPKERKMPHSTFYYPINGGIQTFMNAIADGLNIKCDYAITNLKKKDNKWIINNSDEFDLVISTLPLPELPAIIKLPKDIVDSINDLKYNSLTTILYDCDKTDISWLYVPSKEYISHRTCYPSAFTTEATPKKDKGLSALEIIGPKFEVTEDFCKREDVLPAELGFNNIIDSAFTKYAYVIHDKNYRKNTKCIFEYFNQDDSLKLLGRWATWNYKNMDLCILDAMNIFNEIEKDKTKK